MDFDEFKAVWDASVEKWRWEDPENHAARVFYDAVHAVLNEPAAESETAPTPRPPAGKGAPK